MRIARTALTMLVLLAGAAGVFVPRNLGVEERASPTIVRLLFVGDMMFDRTMRTIAERSSYATMFSCLDAYLRSFDLTVGNLEGPITFADSVSVGTLPGMPGNTSFTFSPVVAHELAQRNMKVISLGNNHILDRGWEGIESTMRVLEDNGVSYFGLPEGSVSTTSVIHGKTIGLVNFNQFFGRDGRDKTIRAIETLRERGAFVVVYAHWGEEYASETDVQRLLGRAFVDAGADLVIGSHPHVIQAVETYKGRKIYYSLGNFIFDQYWTREVSTGMGVEVVLVGYTPTFKERFFSISRDGTTCFLPVDKEENAEI